MKRNVFLTTLLCSAVTASCMIGGTTAFAAESTNASDETVVYVYKQLDMPIVTIDTKNNAVISSKEDYVDATVNIIDNNGDYEMTDTDVAVRLRGNSSLQVDKKSYKLKFDKKQNLLNIGDGKGKTWALVANYYDASLLRNLATYQFADKLTGMPYTPNCRSVEVYLNGEYEGVYLLCETVNVNKSRVNITEAPDEVEDEGYLVEMSRYTTADSFTVDTETYEVKSDLSETSAIKAEQINYISDYLGQCMAALKSGNQEEVEQYMDVDSLVDIYIGNEIVKNVDAGWDSFYMYKDAGEKLYFGPMWDFDLALGNVNGPKGFDSWQGFNPYNVLNINANSNPWFCYALSCDWFRQLVQDRWNELQGDVDAISDTVIQEAESNYNSYCRNFERWDVLGHQVYTEPEELAKFTTFKEHYIYLSDWIENRAKWLTNYFAADAFTDGTFVDSTGEALSADTNLIAFSPLLAFAIPPADITYTMTDNTGMILNIKNGGFANWNVQALASGFMLEEGTDYTLSFDYSCSDNRSTSFAIQQNHDAYAPYVSDTLDMTNALQHYETTFTASANDTNCALALSLGGKSFEGTTVTIDNMSLVKKASTPTVPDTPETPDIPSDSLITAALDITNDWGSGALCNITITNNSDQDLTEGWTLDFDFNRTITNLWCANLVSTANGHYTITNPDWKTTLAAGESYTFGFQVEAGNDFELSNAVVK